MGYGRMVLFLLIINTMVSLGTANRLVAEYKCITYDDLPLEYLVLKGEVLVKAVFTIRNLHERKPQSKDSCIDDYVETDIHVSKGDKTYKTQMGLAYIYELDLKAFDYKVEEIKRKTGWKEGYLFVPDSCGLGNARRCNVDCVFAVRQGELVKLGYVLAGSKGPPGQAYRNGLFYDIDCQIEATKLTSHSTAPVIGVVKKEKNNKLVIDLEKTCANYKYWQPPEKTPVCKEKETRPADDDEFEKGDLLLQATMAQYCGRPDLVEKWMDVAKCTFGKKTFKLFQEEIARVRPPGQE